MLHKIVPLAKKVSALIIIAAILSTGTSFAANRRNQHRENIQDRLEAMRELQAERTAEREERQARRAVNVTIKAPETGAVIVDEPQTESPKPPSTEDEPHAPAPSPEPASRPKTNLPRPTTAQPVATPDPAPAPAPQPDPQPVQTPPPAPQNAVLGNVAGATFAGVNAERRKAGVPELALAQDAVNMAVSHSQDMAAAGKLLNHTDLKERLQQFISSYTSAAENEAYNTVGTAEKAVSQWMHSPSHRDSMLNGKYSKGGVGVVSRDGRYYYTLILYN